MPTSRAQPNRRNISARPPWRLHLPYSSFLRHPMAGQLHKQYTVDLYSLLEGLTALDNSSELYQVLELLLVEMNSYTRVPCDA